MIATPSKSMRCTASRSCAKGPDRPVRPDERTARRMPRSGAWHWRRRGSSAISPERHGGTAGAHGWRAGFDVAQALRDRQLPVQKRDELVSGRQPAHPRIGPVRSHQPIEHMPRHVLQHGVKYAILMPHGVDLLPCPDTLPDVRKTEESAPCAPLKLNRTAVQWHWRSSGD